MKLFGTDGIRGIYGDNLTSNLAYKLGINTAKVLKENKDKLTLLVATDTRISKDVLKFALISGCLEMGVNIIDLGVIPTPAISYLIKKYHADGGFVVSASHNPHEYNGIKVFNENGFKLSDELEENIETLIFNNDTESGNEPGIYEYRGIAKSDYVKFLRSTITEDISNLKIVIDTANGSSYETAKMLFSDLNSNVTFINDNPDGININLNAGSTHLEGLISKVKELNADVGIAFDGDADRCLMIDDNGEVIDGDYILAIYSNYLKENNKLHNNALVGTIMSNLGLIKYCESNNILFDATKVGDRYVLESMMNNDYILGGEQSGHVIFKDYLNTGDGELTALQMLKVMSESNKKLSELKNVMVKYPQVLKNVNVSKEGKDNYKNNEIINNFIKEEEMELNGEGRIVVRPSGTENLIRVMLEGKDVQKITSICDEIVEIINKELN